ncbi:flagellar motor protein MotB [Clostridium butyricum]|uniref:Chemotaxis protein MotB n=3 Tax=root TaxID=1 RepID=C4IDK1_CLOBU|nr:OmpA family protein [Clostridium butyricum]APF24647.1 membrane MotB of proton-channel complex MotA/MotB family protein [Clostridium butyricum]EDT75228.1 chemotaxis protein MotB [Clostridium butyricum 5521]EEP55191.1 chemotaxis protein MotB [Clostridium butyricum E4 str. BoNT E BL5262]KHD15770.1 chemotaxis protein MotB [Clostridium butyricum]NFL31288.1 chemotaxis protein MotB [Clostridium butyricum]
MARKKKSSNNELTGDEWLGTYSDCVTLLMTFFVLLYSMSTVDAQKVQAISQAFSIMSGKSTDSILQYDMYQGSQPVLGGESKIENTIQQSENIDKKTMYEDVKEFVDKNQLNTTIDIAQDENGVVLQLRDNILFESGKADLIDGSSEILDKINTLISTLPNSIVIEGHTDNVPISTSIYKDNWDLSTARASNVLRYFTQLKGQDPTRFSAAGYGEYRPKVDNSTDENRAQNRRVNILIVSNNEE